MAALAIVSLCRSCWWPPGLPLADPVESVPDQSVLVFMFHHPFAHPNQQHHCNWRWMAVSGSDHGNGNGNCIATAGTGAAIVLAAKGVAMALAQMGTTHPFLQALQPAVNNAGIGHNAGTGNCNHNLNGNSNSHGWHCHQSWLCPGGRNGNDGNGVGTCNRAGAGHHPSLPVLLPRIRGGNGNELAPSMATMVLMPPSMELLSWRQDRLNLIHLCTTSGMEEMAQPLCWCCLLGEKGWLRSGHCHGDQEDWQ